MKTLLKCHMKSNNFDGYPAHHHWMLLDIHPKVYLELGTVFPSKTLSAFVENPWTCRFVRENVTRVGYDFLTEVDPEHRGFYVFGNLHDGIDGQVTDAKPALKYGERYTAYINPNGTHSSCEIFGVDDYLELGEVWAKHPLTNRYIRGKLKEGTTYVTIPFREWSDRVVKWNGKELTAYYE